MSYGFVNAIKVQPGHQQEVAAILLESASGLAAAGCHLYLVSEAADDDQTIWVTEIWESKRHHQESLRLPETRDAIERTKPMLTGEFDPHPLRVRGGLGVPLAD